MIKVKKLTQKIMYLVVIGFMLINVFPILARSSGIGDILVGSDITENSRLRLEMFLYKANDQDPNYDYYLVELNMFEKAYSNDIFVEIWDIQTYIYCYTSFGDIDALETYREPDPGWYAVETPVTVSYYGFYLDIWLPAGLVSYWYDGSNENKPRWRVDAIMGGWGSVPATRNEADFTIGFRVSQGAHVTIYANCHAAWYRWFFIWLSRVTYGWGSQCHIYY